MPDRATYLSRVLISRLRSLEGVLREDGLNEDAQMKRRRELIAKVLAVEAGITDEAKVRLVASAMPHLVPDVATLDRDQQELAGFLRERLVLE